MLKIWLHQDISDREGGAACEAYLSRRLPPRQLAWMLQGQDLLIFPDGAVHETAEETGCISGGGDAEKKVLLTRQAYWDWKRLPVGTAVFVSAEGMQIYQTGRRRADLSAYRTWNEPHPLEGVCTLQEACSLYQLSETQIMKICRQKGKAAGSLRRSGTVTLIRKSVLDQAAGQKSQTFFVNPLLLVFSSIEAADLWNRPSGDVRSAAAGSGHRAARMLPEECRHTGKIWLVTRSAMERVYGGFDGQKMAQMTALLFPEGPFLT